MKATGLVAQTGAAHFARHVVGNRGGHRPSYPKTSGSTGRIHAAPGHVAVTVNDETSRQKGGVNHGPPDKRITAVCLFLSACPPHAFLRIPDAHATAVHRLLKNFDEETSW